MNSRGLLQAHSSLLDLIMRALDLLAISLAGLIAFYWQFGNLVLPNPYRITILLGLLFTTVLFFRFALYRTWRGSPLGQELRTVTGAWISVFLGLAVMAFIVQPDGRLIWNEGFRSWALLWLGLGWIFLMLFRVVLRLTLRTLRAKGHNTRRIVVVSSSQYGARVVDHIQQSPWTGFQVAGYFDDRCKERTSPSIGVPYLGRFCDIEDYVRNHYIDQIWLVFPFRAEDRVKQLLHQLRHCTADIRLVPDVFGFKLLNMSLSEVAGVPVLNLTSTPMVGFNRLIKAVEDRVLALLILILISPLMVTIAIGVKLSSPGPVFFRQLRHGYDGRPIKVLKFRSMKPHREEEGKVTQARRNDARITPFGAFIRRTSLDELPQFFNVLDGSMSIVGPRPHALAHGEEYKELVSQYMLRHKVKPGITGWAQINGYRGETDTLDKMQKRVEYDLYYIEHWSLLFDLKIILLTVLKGFGGKNAY